MKRDMMSKKLFVSNIILKGLIFIETKSAFLIVKLLFLGVVSLFGKFLVVVVVVVIIV